MRKLDSRYVATRVLGDAMPPLRANDGRNGLLDKPGLKTFNQRCRDRE